MSERYIAVSDDEYCYFLDTMDENYKTFEDFEKIEIEEAKKDNIDIEDYEDDIYDSARDKYWEWVYNNYLEASDVEYLLNKLYEENEILKNGLSDDGLTIADLIKRNQELSADLQIYEQKVSIVLQNQLNKYFKRAKEGHPYDDVTKAIHDIADRLGVELK